MERMQPIVGKTPASIWVNEGEDTLVLGCEEGALVCDTDGDCCSETWWADAIGVLQYLRGTVVTGIREIEMTDSYNVDDGRTRQEEDSAYGVQVTTDQGAVDLVFRNSSNGYYGGSAYYRWVDAPWEPAADFRQITEDWRA